MRGDPPTLREPGMRAVPAKLVHPPVAIRSGRVVAALTRHAESLRSAAPPADERQASGSARELMRGRHSRVARIRSAPDHGAHWDRRETSFRPSDRLRAAARVSHSASSCDAQNRDRAEATGGGRPTDSPAPGRRSHGGNPPASARSGRVDASGLWRSCAHLGRHREVRLASRTDAVIHSDSSAARHGGRGVLRRPGLVRAGRACAELPRRRT